MKVELAIAGATCFALAIGHGVIGRRWVVPNFTRDHFPRTPFGSPSMTLGMVRFTWHIVTVMLVAFAILLMMLAGGEGDVNTLVLRWLSAFWFAATAMAIWNARRRPGALIRFPVPLLMLIVAMLSWTASM